MFWLILTIMIITSLPLLTKKKKKKNTHNNSCRQLTVHLSDTISIAQHLKKHSCPITESRKILTENATILKQKITNKNCLTIYHYWREKRFYWDVKCNQPRPEFKIVSPCSFLTTRTITLWASKFIYIYICVCVCVCVCVCACVCVCIYLYICGYIWI